MNTLHRILLISNAETDTAWIDNVVHGENFKVTTLHYSGQTGLIKKLHQAHWSLVILFCPFNNNDELQILHTIRSADAQLPCLFVSESNNETLAAEVIKAGASDFISKVDHQRLIPVIRRELVIASLYREKRMVEQQLNETEDQYRKLFEAASDAIAILDGEKIIQCNLHMALMLGIPRHKITGSRLTDLSPAIQDNGLDSVQCFSNKLAVIREGIPMEFEWQFLNGKQGLLYSDLTLSPFLVKDKKLFVAVIRDISERKIAQRNRHLINRILETLNKSTDLKESLCKILKQIKDSLKIDAIALSLKKDLKSAFPLAFEPGSCCDLQEACSCTDYKDGMMIKISGNIIFNSCLYGQAILEDLSIPREFFTPKGSFFTGSINEFLERSDVENVCLWNRQCQNAGYQSTSIIPIKTGEEIIGTLQLSDQRSNLFSAEQVADFEDIAAVIGDSLKRMNDEELIRQSETKFRRLIANSTNAIILLNEKGLITHWNPAAEALTGIKEYEILDTPAWETEYLSILSQGFPDLLPGEGLQGLRLLLGSGVSPEASTSKPIAYQKKTGEVAYIQVRLFSIKTTQGYYIGSILHDITGLMLSQEHELRNMKNLETLSKTAMEFMSLPETGEVYSYISATIAEFIPQSIVLTGPFDEFSNNILITHAAGLPIETGMHAGLHEAQGLPLFRCPLTADHISIMRKQKIQSLPEELRTELRKSTEIIKNLTLPDTYLKWRTYTVGLSDESHFYGLIIIVVSPGKELNQALIETFTSQASVTLSKQRILQDLQKSQYKFNSLFEQNNDIVFTIDKDFNLTSINPAGESLLTGKFSPGSPLKTFLDPLSFQRLYTIFAETVRNKRPFRSGEIELLSREGRILTFQLNVSFSYRGSQVIEIFGIARNITTNKTTQNQVLSKVIETEEREKKAFAEELHDGIGALLSTVNIYTTLIEKKGRSSAERSGYLSEIRNLVNQAIDEVRLFTFSYNPNVLNDFGLGIALQMFKDKADLTHPGLITLEFPAEWPAIEKIAEISLYRILTELTTHAMKYNEPGAIRITLKADQNQLIVNFQSNGKKVDMEQDSVTGTDHERFSNIIARVKSIQGLCSFSSTADQGQSVNILIPIKKNKND